MDIHFLYYHIMPCLIHRIHHHIFLLNEEDIILMDNFKYLVNMNHLNIFIIFMDNLILAYTQILKHNIFNLHI